MKKGVVLSVNKFSITLLTPDGEFEKCRRLQRNYEIGEEITYQPQESVLTSFFSISGKKTAVMSAAVACLMLFSIVIPNLTSEVSAYMTIDVNPSIELGVDDDLQVVELRGINADGERVISNISDWKNKDLSDVAEQIVLKTEELGYFKDSTRKIIVSNTVIDDDKTIEKQLSQEIKGFTNDISANAKVKLIHATEMDRKQAEQQGISTGKYLERKYEKEKSKQPMKKKNDSQLSDQEKKVSYKGQVESEHKKVKATDQNQPVKGKEVESKKTTNGIVKSNPGKKGKPKSNSNSKNKKNTGNKINQASKVKSERKSNQGNKGKSEAKSNQERGVKGNSGNNGNSAEKGNSENNGKSGDKGNSENNGKSGDKGNSENNGKSGDKENSGNNGNSEDKGNSGNNGNSTDKGNSEHKGNPGNNGHGNSENNGNSGDKGNSGNNGNSENKGNPSNNGNGKSVNNSNFL